MPRTADVIIDGKPHTVTELKPRLNAEWRRAFQTQASAVLEMVGELPSIEGAADLARLAQQYGPLVIEKAEQVHALCCAYDKAFEDAYESEAVEALPAVLGLAFPFGGLLEMLDLNAGPSEVSTLPSSPLLSGDAGTTS